MNVLDLFSGVGGMALGFHRAGLQPIAFCEADPFARTVLARAWPDVPCYPDIHGLSSDKLRADGVARAEILCGGFPCQDVSTAGRGAGIDGSRSVLWREMLRLVRECRPDWVVVESVPALRVRGADRIMDGLDEAGYTCWPLVVGAAHAGAPHRRGRVFILAHATGAGLASRLGNPAPPPPGVPAQRHCGWQAQPGMGRVADGVPARVDRLRALGNAVVPDIAEMIAHAVLAAHAVLITQTLTAPASAASRPTR